MDGSYKSHPDSGIGFPPEESWYWSDRLIRQDHFHLRDKLGDGTIMVEYDEEDPTDYTAWGYWSYATYDNETVLGDRFLEIGAIATGPDFDDPANYVSNLNGTATYQGNFSGQALAISPELNAIESAEYFASVDLIANFNNDTISGCIGCRNAGLYDYELYEEGLGRTVYEKEYDTDISITLGSTLITTDGKFNFRNVTVKGSGITSSGGNFASRFTSKEGDRPQDAIRHSYIGIQ